MGKLYDDLQKSAGVHRAPSPDGSLLSHKKQADMGRTLKKLGHAVKDEWYRFWDF